MNCLNFTSESSKLLLMHRELSNVDEAFAPPRTAGLYLLTAVLVLLVGRDLWPQIAGWLNTFGLHLPIYSNVAFRLTWRLVGADFNVRYALIAAAIGGVRILVSSIEGLTEGKV